jgi:hypothetical protein
MTNASFSVRRGNGLLGLVTFAFGFPFLFGFGFGVAFVSLVSVLSVILFSLV